MDSQSTGTSEHGVDELSAMPEASKISEVLEWLKVKGADNNILSEIDRLKEAEEAASAAAVAASAPVTLQELQAKHQSASARLSNTEWQLGALNDRVAIARKTLDTLETARDDCANKRAAIQNELDGINSRIKGPADGTIESKEAAYERVIAQLQELVKEGVPEDKEKRREVYDLIYAGVKAGAPPHSAEPTLTAEHHNGVTAEPCPATGFGPTLNRPVSDKGPYAKGSCAGSLQAPITKPVAA